MGGTPSAKRKSLARVSEKVSGGHQGPILRQGIMSLNHKNTGRGEVAWVKEGPCPAGPVPNLPPWKQRESPDKKVLPGRRSIIATLLRYMRVCV